MKKTISIILTALLLSASAAANPTEENTPENIILQENETTPPSAEPEKLTAPEATVEPDISPEEVPEPTAEPEPEMNPEPTVSPELQVTPEPTTGPEQAEEMTITTLYIHGKRVYLSKYPLLENGVLLLPIREYLENVLKIEYVGTNDVMLSANGHQVILEAGSETAHFDGKPVTLDVAPLMLGDTLYAPMRAITEHFGEPVSAQKIGNELIVKVGSTLSEAYVNGKKLTSDTPYLIWLKKSDYTLRVFLNEGGKWRECYSCVCGIGAVGTPTITGTFKFYSLENRWTYADFYVGPIMRFRGGYAIHSTLLKYDGTDYNATVGKKLSHGCVRVRPKDMEWLTYYVPLGTTVHITEN